MSVALFSTAYFPPLAYVATLMRYDSVAVEYKETFPKQTYRNRMLILTAGGVRPLTVPVVRENHSRTDEVTIDYHTRWNIVHLRTLVAAYAASPYFLFYKDELESLLTTHYSRLVDLNRAIMEWMLRKMKIECVMNETTDYQPDAAVPDDYRTAFSPKHPFDESSFPAYYQVFADRLPFVPNLSALDLMMNMGPEARGYLEKLQGKTI